MIGYARTPDWLAQQMVEKVLDSPVSSDDRILFPGVGKGPFVKAVTEYCEANGWPTPQGVGVDVEPEHVAICRDDFDHTPFEFREEDYLQMDATGEFDYVIGNPPYVSLEDIPDKDRDLYAEEFDTASGRFDLYFLFFEQALEHLTESGRLAFVTPEKFEYVDSAECLRQLLAPNLVELEHVDEDAFTGLAAYPTVSVLDKSHTGKTTVRHRDNSEFQVELPADGRSWASCIRGGVEPPVDSPVTLGDICKRVSCGVATGEDEVFVRDPDGVPSDVVERIGHKTVAGEELGEGSDDVILIPYDSDGNLLDESAIPACIDYFEQFREQLEDRWCVREDDTKWYGWHQRPPIDDLKQSKIMCQDVTDTATFYIDKEGDTVPQHSVYFIIPNESVNLEELAEYLNKDAVERWLEGHCQHASNGFLRLQSSVLERLPVPKRFADTYQSTLGETLE